MLAKYKLARVRNLIKCLPVAIIAVFFLFVFFNNSSGEDILLPVQNPL